MGAVSSAASLSLETSDAQLVSNIQQHVSPTKLPWSLVRRYGMEALLDPSEQFPTNISSAVLCQSKRFDMGQKSKDHCRWLLYMYADWIRVSCCTLDNDKRKRI